MREHKKVIIIDIVSPDVSDKEAEKRMIESENLVDTYWGFVVEKKFQKKQDPDYRYFVGTWKIEEIKQIALEKWVDLIIINNQLKTQQVFNIEWEFFQDTDIKVWDRVDLILNIFSKHATTSEAKMQIELAAISHMGPRIFWMWLELSKQGWGIWTRWKWETNTEIMKRHLKRKETLLKTKIKQLEKRRENQRLARERRWLKSVAIVGYTNAWKSQLMNGLSKKKVKAKDELFATLDTRTWELFLPNHFKTCLISDTIWFIRNLPPKLIQAFKSTLEEAIHADLILHVVDFSDPEKDEKIKVTNEILESLWAEKIPRILVWNKIDLLKKLQTKTFERKYKKFEPIFVSALNKIWLKELVWKIDKKFFG